ncbi:MAG: hypothetical protein IPK99_07335 [Flavobacteriales bacterium]|nr:hypothetical protein [Flavobacteriales bacterium]
MKFRSLVVMALGLGLRAQAQTPVMDPALARDYEIGGLTVSGTTTVDVNAVMLFSGLKVGQNVTLPGPRIADAVRNIWAQKLFTDVRVEAAEIRGGTIFLNIVVTEKPRLSRFKFDGITKSDADKLREQLQLVRGQQVNEALLSNTRSTISRYYVDKGFMKADAVITQVNDTLMDNSVMLLIDVRKGKKVHIKDVRINGNEALSDAKVRRSLKKTRRKNWYNPFGSSKFIAKTYRVDKENLISEYNEKGYRNATIVRDTTYFVNNRKLMVEIDVEEGNKFYFREIYFTGNTKHTDRELLDILNIKRGDVYNKTVLDSRMYMNQSGRDISSLYMDDGYLSFYPEVVEVAVGDSIDLDIRIREGKQYRVRNVIIKGNTKTNEHVIRREIRTKPGQLFNRSDVLRTQR